MNKPYLYSGIGLLAVAFTVATCGMGGHPVALKTGSLSSNPDEMACYTSGTEGDLVADPVAGTAVVETRSGHRYAVTWPLGYTGRSSWSGVEVINRSGSAVARTGSWVRLTGGYWTDGSFLACNVVP
jgi:hypothetical protein